MPNIRHRHTNYEPSPEYDAPAYRVKYYDGIAWYVLGWETAPDEDTEWTGMETKTGNLLMVMIGDDRKHSVDPEDVEPIDEDDYCPSCGQIGCGHGR